MCCADTHAGKTHPNQMNKSFKKGMRMILKGADRTECLGIASLLCRSRQPAVGLWAVRNNEYGLYNSQLSRERTGPQRRKFVHWGNKGHNILLPENSLGQCYMPRAKQMENVPHFPLHQLRKNNINFSFIKINERLIKGSWLSLPLLPAESCPNSRQAGL